MSAAAPAFRFLRNLILWSAALIAVIEIVFRIYPPAGLSRDQLIRGGAPDVALIEPHPYLSYTLTRRLRRPALNHNSLGYRGAEIQRRKAPGVIRLLCLGASSTYGVGASSDATTWPTRLQARLNTVFPTQRFEVVNGGVPGYTTYESMIQLAVRGIDLQPDIVILYQGFNDMRAGTWPNVRRDNTHFRKSWDARAPLATSVLELSETYLLARWFATDFKQRQVELSRYVVVPDNGDQLVDAARRANPIAIESFGRNVLNTIAIARANGARIIVAVEAYGERTIAPEIADLVDESMSGMAAELDRVVDAAADPGVRTFNARQTLPNAAGLFEDGVHMTDAGADRLAGLLLRRLVELTWLQPDARPSETRRAQVGPY